MPPIADPPAPDALGDDAAPEETGATAVAASKFLDIEDAGSGNPLVMVLRADPASPSIARERLRGWLGAMNWPETDADDIVTAANEAVSNAAEHAYPPDPPGEVYVVARRVMRPDGTCCVAIGVSDDGRWRVPPVDPSYRGHGIRMMRSCMDHVMVDGRADGTMVMMMSRPIPEQPAE